MVAVKKGVKDLQLNRDLKKQPYKSVLQSFRSIIHAEGFAGLQKGLVSALAFQFCMNSVRLGTYQTVDNLGWNRRKNGELHPGLCIFWGRYLKLWEAHEKAFKSFSNIFQSGGMSGIFGSTVGCPLYMIKTQLQAQSHGTYAVGFQHGHKGTASALKRIMRENGIRGMGKAPVDLKLHTLKFTEIFENFTRLCLINEDFPPA